jgi:hypothetical protein
MEVTLKFSLDNLNALLTALAKQPFAEVAGFINEIHVQAGPQIVAEQAKIAAQAEEVKDSQENTES